MPKNSVARARVPSSGPFRRFVAAGVALGTLSLVASSAQAGGFEVPENGTRALGRAGAYVATVDEPSAVYFNPAALTRIKDNAFTLNMNLVDMRMEYRRSPYVFDDVALDEEAGPEDRRTVNFDPVKNQAGPFPAPMAFAATRFKLDKPIVFGFGLYGPSAYGIGEYPTLEMAPAGETDICGYYRPCVDLAFTDVDESTIQRDGGQSYMVTRRSILQVFPSFSVAYRFEDLNLSLGATAQAVILLVDFDIGMDGAGTEVPYDPTRELYDLYTPVNMKATGFSATGILGVLWDPIPELSVGLSYRPRFKVNAAAKLDIQFPPKLAGAGLSISSNEGRLRVRQPDILRMGVAYRHLNEARRETFNIELDATYELWSWVNGFDVEVRGKVTSETGSLVTPRPIKPVHLPRNFNNTVSLRLGSDLSMLRNPETGNGPIFRLGALWESNGIPDEWTNLDFVPFMRVGGTVGFSYHIRRWSIDTALAYIWSPERTVTDGKYHIILPLWVCGDPAAPTYDPEVCGRLTTADVTHAVNNGTYKTHVKTASLGFTYGW